LRGFPLHLITGGVEGKLQIGHFAEFSKSLSFVRIDEVLYLSHLKLSHPQQCSPGGYLIAETQSTG
jgi:hypothetical protein